MPYDESTRFGEEGQSQHEAGRLHLAAIALVGISAYAGVRHFPRALLARAADAIENVAGPKLKDWLPKLYQNLDIAGRAAFSASEPIPGDVRFSGMQTRDIFLEEDLERAIQMIAGDSALGGSADLVVQSMKNQAYRMGGLNPYTGLRRATLDDGLRVVGDRNDRLTRFVGGALHHSEDEWDRLFSHSQMQRIGRKWSRLTSLPSFQAALQRSGLTAQELAEQTPLGPGMFFTTGDEPKFLGASRFTFNRTLQWLLGDPSAPYKDDAAFGWFKDRRIPFTTFRPFSLLYPTEMFRDSPDIAYLDRALGGVESEGVVYLGGKVFPYGERRVLRDPLMGNFRLGSSRSGMATGAAARSQGVFGIMVEGHVHKVDQPTVDYLQQLGALEPSNVTDYAAAPGSAGKVRAASAANKYGIGPQYSTRPLGGRIGDFFTGLFRKTTGTPKMTEEFARGWAYESDEIIPESKWLGNILRDDRGLPPPTSIDELSFGERVQLKVGADVKRHVSITTSGGTRTGKFTAAGWTNVAGRESALTGREYSIWQTTPEARVSFKKPWYAFREGAEGVFDWLNFQAARPSWLLEEMTGLGMQPTKNFLSTAARLTLGTGLPIYFSWQAGKYLEYKSAQVFGQGPFATLADIYSFGRIGMQSVLETAGVVQKARELEEEYPGIVSSDASSIARLAGGTVAGMLTGRLMPNKLAGGLALLTGLTTGMVAASDLTKSADELKQIYAGTKKVPIKKNRWWVLGLDPFSGGEIERFDTHWVHKMKSWSKEKSIYGSVRESWRGSWLPTPENAFLLKNLFDPYYVERENYAERPYPRSGTYFSEVPLFGPFLGATVGQVFKPSRKMHPSYWRGDTTTDPRTPEITQSEIATTAMMGEAMPRLSTPPSQKRYSLEVMTQQQLHNAFEFSGLPGFMYSTMYKWGTGNDLIDNQAPTVADSGEITSAARSYYDKNLGGLLGLTELVRRFFVRKIGKDFNPVPNQMPSWLPGNRADQQGDRDYYLDFHRGDAYAKLSMGEAKLPGAGYEAIHGLHSGVPGVYDPVDRFLILADVAPTSDAYRHYKVLVEGWGKAGLIRQKWKVRLGNAMKEAQAMMASQPFEYNPWEYRFPQQDITIEEVLTPTKFRANGQLFELAGVQSADQASALWADDKDTLKRKKKGMQLMGRQLQSMIGQSVKATIGPSGTVTTPVIVPGLNDMAESFGLHNTTMEPIHMQARAGGEPSFTMKAWQELRHAELPGPFNTVARKLFTRPTPMQKYKEEVIRGYHYSDWEDPFGTWIKPWALQLGDMVGIDYIPGNVRKNRRVDEYFDALQYTKARRMQKLSQQAGMSELSAYWKGQAGGTMMGFPAVQTYPAAMSATPKAERPFFHAFSQAITPEQRGEVVRMTPTGTRDIWLSAWSRSGGRGSGLSPQALRALELKQQAGFPARDRAAADYFSGKNLPDENWLGWHPSVPMSGFKVRTARNEGLDIHDFDLWESEERMILDRMPYVEPVRSPFSGSGSSSYFYHLLNNVGKMYDVRPTHFGGNRIRVQQREYTVPLQERQAIRKGSI